MATKKKALPKPYAGSVGRAIERVFAWLGVGRVERAMTHTCRLNQTAYSSPKLNAERPFQNKGWANCFMTQAVGGKAELSKLRRRYKAGNVEAIAMQLAPPADKTRYWDTKATAQLSDDIDTLINCFDGNEEKFFVTANQWLKKFHV